MDCRSRIHACPVETSLEILSGKWKPRVLWKLRQEGVVRFSRLQRGMPDVTPKMLTQVLRELERDGLVTRKVYAEVPPRVEYRLSSLGESLVPILDALAEWGLAHHSEIVTVLASSEPADRAA